MRVMRRDMTPEQLVAAFWATTRPAENGDCILWCGRKVTGYGRFFIGNGRSILAHRWIYEQTVGPIADGLFAMHLCDVPACVNPGHIIPGTPRENTRDCITKGRSNPVSPRGEAKSKLLTDEAVLSIRERVAAGCTQSEMAREYGVSRQRIGQIIYGTGWKHIAGPIRERPISKLGRFTSRDQLRAAMRRQSHTPPV